MRNYNDYTMFIDYLIPCFAIAMIAIVWINIVTSPANIFYPLKEYLYGKINDLSFGKKILKVLFECEYCLSGQITFWYFVFHSTSIIDIITAPFITMYLVIILKKVW